MSAIVVLCNGAGSARMFLKHFIIRNPEYDDDDAAASAAHDDDDCDEKKCMHLYILSDVRMYDAIAITTQMHAQAEMRNRRGNGSTSFSMVAFDLFFSTFLISIAMFQYFARIS